MCEFISWIEVSKGNDTHLLYLTDAEVFSSHGRDVLEGCQDNDVIGHGAIRKYYDLGHDGLDHEQRAFWETSKIPDEIVKNLIDFDKHWGKMFRSGYFMNNNLRYIIKYAPDKWRGKARKMLQN